MKRNIYCLVFISIIISSSLISLISSSYICPKYSCKELENDICALKNVTQDNVEISISPCSSNSNYCPIDQLNDLSVERVSCLRKDNSLAELPSYPMIECLNKSNCISGSNCDLVISGKKYCSGIFNSNTECTSHNQCSYDKVCREDPSASNNNKVKYCLTAISQNDITLYGTKCSSSYECSNDSFCNPETQICTKLFSIETNKASIVSDLNTSLFSKMNIHCKTGLSDSDNICRDLKLKIDNKKCNTDSDCVYIYTNEENIEKETTIKDSCECGFNNKGDKYCFNPVSDSNSNKLSDYIKTTMSILSSKSIKCHSLERFNCKDLSYHYSNESYLLDIKNKLAKKNSYDAHLYYNSDNCTEAAYNYFLANKCPVTHFNKKANKINSSDDDKCIVSKGKLDELRTTNISSCTAKNSFCDSNKTQSNKILSDEDYFQTCSQLTSSANTKYPGESCLSDDECIENIVLDYDGTSHKVKKCNKKNVCEGTKQNDMCNSYSMCEAGNYCDDSYFCVPYYKKGNPCDYSEECENGLFCYIYYSQGLVKIKSCVPIFSLPLGSDISLLPEAIKEIACFSGTYYNNKCARQVYNNNKHIPDKNGLVKCEFGSKCEYVYYFSNIDIDVEEKDCVCAYNEQGQGYCPFSTHDDSTIERFSNLIYIKKTNLNTLSYTKNKMSIEKTDGIKKKCYEYYSNVLFNTGNTNEIKRVFNFEDCPEDMNPDSDNLSKIGVIVNQNNDMLNS